MKTLLVAIALAALPAFGQSRDVPPETKQFDFLVGLWQVEVKPKVPGLAAMIHGVPKLTGTWKAWRSLDGLGVEDELRIIDASGNPISLTHAMRIYSKAEGRWKLSGVDAYRARTSESTGALENGEMRTSGRGLDADGKPSLTRTRYLDVTPNGFRMRQDRSSDNGQTWDEGVLEIIATRAAGR